MMEVSTDADREGRGIIEGKASDNLYVMFSVQRERGERRGQASRVLHWTGESPKAYTLRPLAKKYIRMWTLLR